MTAFTARRKIDQAMLGVLAVVVTVLSSCGGSKPVAAPTTTQAPLPSPAQQNATHQVKIDYRRLIVHAAEGFARATIALNAALDHNNHAEAVKQWAIAQGDFDALRPAMFGGPAASAEYDGLVADFAPGEQSVGLHEVERGLFTGHDELAAKAAPALARAGPAIVIGLYRTIVQPSGVATKQVEQLGFLVDHVIAHHQEVFSHLDQIDVAAIVGSVRKGFSAIAPLGVLVDPSLTAKTERDLVELERGARAIAPGTKNENVAPALWRGLSEAAAKLQVDFGQLSGEFSGYSTGRAYA
ncbi:MAG: hypothetical protein WCK25_00535 [Actinomycetes bacterium]